jgi:hypothetical protein
MACLMFWSSEIPWRPRYQKPPETTGDPLVPPSCIPKLCILRAALRLRLEPLLARLRHQLLRLDGAKFVELAPLALPLAFLPWFLVFAERSLEQPLFRDPAMMHMMAWCMRRGQKLYEDVAMPNGPLIYVIHALIQIFAGESERALRKADLVLQIVGGGTLGAILAPARHWLSRSVWAAVGAAIWMSYVFTLNWSDTLQRETYYALIASVGLALAYVHGHASTRGNRIAVFVAGFLTCLVVFGKQTTVLYPALALIGLLLAEGPERASWQQRVLWFTAGGVAVSALMLLVLVVFGSLPGFWYWFVVYPLRVYRFQHAIAWDDALMGIHPINSVPALTATLAGVFAIAFRLLPRAAIVLVGPPLLLLLAGAAQRKGWQYHFQPAIVGVAVASVLAMAAAWKVVRSAKPQAGAWAVVALVCWYWFGRISESPWRAAKTGADQAPDIIVRAQVADFLRAKTRDDARVLYYGIDPYTLYLAKRLPADPHIVSFELTYDPAVAQPPSKAAPTPEERHVIDRLQQEAANRFCSRIMRAPPQAVVLDPVAGNMGADPLQDILKWCPDFRAELEGRYEPPQRFGPSSVYVRRE